MVGVPTGGIPGAGPLVNWDKWGDPHIDVTGRSVPGGIQKADSNNQPGIQNTLNSADLSVKTFDTPGPNNTLFNTGFDINADGNDIRGTPHRLARVNLGFQ